MGESLRLGQLVTIQRGTTYKSALIGKPGPVLLGLGTIQRHGGFRGEDLRTYGGDSPDKLLVRPGELYASLKDVTQTADVLGAVARVPANGPLGRLTQDTVRLDPISNHVSRDYIYWVLRTPQYRDYCRAHATGTTTMGLSREDFFAFEVPVASPQRLALSELLKALDDKIAANERILASSDAFVRSKFGTLQGPPVLLSNLADLVRDHVEPDRLDPKVSYVGLEHVPRRRLWLSDHGQVTDVISAKSAFRPGDVLFGKLRPYFHKVARAPFSGVASTDILVIRAKNMALAGLVLCAASSEQAIRLATAASEGTRMPRTNWGHVGSVEVPWPGESAARAFSAAIESIAQHTAHIAVESRALAGTRNALLPLLMSGKVRVRDAEKIAEEVL